MVLSFLSPLTVQLPLLQYLYSTMLPIHHRHGSLRTRAFSVYMSHRQSFSGLHYTVLHFLSACSLPSLLPSLLARYAGNSAILSIACLSIPTSKIFHLDQFNTCQLCLNPVSCTSPRPLGEIQNSRTVKMAQC